MKQAQETIPDMKQLSALIQALPTKEDIQTLAKSIMGALKEEIEEVRAGVAKGECKINNLEEQNSRLEHRVEHMEEEFLRDSVNRWL